MTNSPSNLGALSAYRQLMRREISNGLRKPSLGIYDHNLHLIGGGQKYGCTIAHALQNDFATTLIANRPVTNQQLSKWYGFDLSRVAIKVIPVEGFGSSSGSHLDPASVTRSQTNPFHIVSRESVRYDFFLNNGMNELVYPLSNVSFVMCHFPERRPSQYFYLDRYSQVIYNSMYTAEWIRKRWNVEPDQLIYPPVNMKPPEPGRERQHVILSVARFESGGSKKQLEMIRTFDRLKRGFPNLLESWRLIVAGGSHESNTYLGSVRQLVDSIAAQNVEVRVDLSADEIRDLYGAARIFWHLCGLDETDPALVEHFGMSVAEAMQCGVVPIVFRGGGMTETVEHAVSGYTVGNTAELLKATLELIERPTRWKELSAAASARSKLFDQQRFESQVRDYFRSQLEQYSRASA
jgi:glycosyltransferase involved in cell wall biosynthesis